MKIIYPGFKKNCMFSLLFHLIILRRVVITLSEKEMYKKGFPAYITSVGWMGYSDEKIVQVYCYIYSWTT